MSILSIGLNSGGRFLDEGRERERKKKEKKKGKKRKENNGERGVIKGLYIYIYFIFGD